MTPRHAVAVASLSLAMLGLGGPPPHEPDVAFEGLPDEIELVEADDGQPARFDGQVVVRLFIRDAADLMLVGQLSSDAWTHGPEIGAWSDWRLGRSDLDALRAARIDFEVIIPDLQSMVQAERERLSRPQPKAIAWFSDFRNLAAINARLDELVALRPDICSIVQAGSSIQGRPIRGVRISRHAAGTPVPAFLFTATLHAREWAVPMTAMWFADRLVEDDGLDARLTAIVDSSEIFIFPVMNPDGYEYSWTTNRLWRKNRRLNSGGSYGVDLNRNWATGWGGSGSSGTQSSDTYRGTAAFSEPETAGLRDFVTPRTNIAGHIDLHSYSQIIMWPYSYTSALPPESATYTRVSGAMGNALKAVNNRAYTVGNSWQVYGATAGCIEDWTSTTTGGMGWCTEVRDTGSYGFVMPNTEILPNARENMASATVMMEELLKSSTVTLASGPGSSLTAGVSTAVRVTVTANCGSLVASNPVKLKWKVNGGATQTANMTSASGQWGASLPATACGSTVAWWVEAETNFSVTRWPANDPRVVRTSATQACALPGDLDESGSVDAGDISVLLLRFGSTDVAADLDGSGTVDVGDISVLLLLFG